MEVAFKQLYEASLQCRKGKRKGSQCQRYEADLLENLFATQAALQSCTWQPSPMRRFIVTNGSKPREIHAPAYADRIVHHWLVPRLQGLIEPKFIYDCAANIQGKGTHFAVGRLQRMMRQMLHSSCAKAGKSGYFLQLDIHNFFYSINRNILLQLLAGHLRRGVRNKAISLQQARDDYRLCRILLQAASVGPDQQAARLEQQLPRHKRLHNVAPGYGLPIGNLSSQFFGNVYLNELDQFIKHQLQCRYYVRYVDDCVP